MKRIIRFSFILFLLIASIGKTYAIPKVMTNLLDISSMISYNHENYLVTTKPINIKANQTHTIVLGFSFIGQHLEYITESSYLTIQTANQDFDLLGTIDHTKEVVYYEFSTLLDQIEYLRIPYKLEGSTMYEAMMYEGTYDLFDKFIMYQKEEVYEYGSIDVNIDNPIIPSSLNELVKGQNEQGNDIQTNIIYDEYTDNYQNLGSYIVVYETFDNSIMKRFSLTLNVVDITAPIITLNESIVVSIDKIISKDDIIKKINVSDNVDTLSYLDLVLIEDTYTGKSNVGEYHILVSLTDLSGNASQLNIPILLVDITPPIITGVSDIFLYKSDTPLTNDQLKQKVSATDNSKEPVILEILTNGYNQTKIPGIYPIHFKATDIYQNWVIFVMFVHVIEDTAPTFKIDDLIIKTTNNNHLDDDMLISFLRDKLNEKNLYPSNINISYNEYRGNETKMGSYYVYFDYELNNKTETEKILINVNSEKTNIMIYVYIGLGVLTIASSALIFKKIFYLRKYKRN